MFIKLWKFETTCILNYSLRLIIISSIKLKYIFLNLDNKTGTQIFANHFSKKEVKLVPKIIAREGESFQVTLRKFKKSCEKAGLLSDIKKKITMRNLLWNADVKRRKRAERLSNYCESRTDITKCRKKCSNKSTAI